jgi:hypothetical protein
MLNATAAASENDFEPVEATLDSPAPTESSGVSDTQQPPVSRNATNRNPGRLLFSTFVVLLSVLLFGAAVFMSGLFFLPERYTDYSLLNTIKQQTLEALATSNNVGEPALEPKQIAETPAAPPVPAPIDPALLGSVRALEIKIAHLEKLRYEDSKAFGVLTDDNHALHTTILEQQKRIDSLKRNVGTIANQLPTLVDGQSTLKNRLVSLTNLVLANEQTLASINKQREGHPPFILLSIDEWGNADSAVLELQGEISTASPGDILAGWRIKKLAKPNCVYVSRVGPGGPGDVKLCAEL